MSKGANRGEVAELKGDDKKGRQKIDGKLLPFGGGTQSGLRRHWAQGRKGPYSSERL